MNLQKKQKHNKRKRQKRQRISWSAFFFLEFFCVVVFSLGYSTSSRALFCCWPTMRCGALFSNVVVCIFILYVCLCSFQLFQLFFPSGSFTVESDSLPLSLLSPNAKKIEQLFQRQDSTPLCENSVHVNETARLALYLAYTNNIDCSKAFISLTAGKPFTSRFSCLSIWNTTIHYDPVQKKLAEADIQLGWKLLRSDRTIYVHALFDFEDSKSQRHAVRQFSRDITPLRNLVNLLEASEVDILSTLEYKNCFRRKIFRWNPAKP